MSEQLDRGLVNLANGARDWLVEDLLPSFWHFAEFDSKSPIERLLFTAVMFLSHLPISNMKVGPLSDLDALRIKIDTQKEVLDWAVDYLFTVRSGSGVTSMLAVECDGHDFHERTKEQAARDRDRDRRLQEAGYTVYRFTGSEIYRDAFGCARQVYRWAESAAWKK